MLWLFLPSGYGRQVWNLSELLVLLLTGVNVGLYI